jgi:glycosyltransferase involved in cell wall biosynthesis
MYGSFHGEVHDALESVASVQVVDLAQSFTRLRSQRRASARALSDVAAMHTDAAGTAEEVAAQRARADRLKRMTRNHDIVFSDWVDPATVWLSHTAPRRVRLVVRVHSVDALDAWFPLVDWAEVDEVIVISPALKSLVEDLLALLGVTGLDVTLLPGLVGVGTMDAAKEAGARTTLGLVGWARRVKDVAWALDLLDGDPEWRLRLIGHPLDEPHGSARSRAYHASVLQRMADPHLRDRLDIVGWTDDIPAELRRVGVMLSTSRREGNHHGLVEGAASGAVPVVRDWPLFARRGGARAVYPQDWVVDDLEHAIARIRAMTVDDRTWEAARLKARREALELFDPDSAAEQYRTTVIGTSPRVPPERGESDGESGQPRSTRATS